MSELLKITIVVAVMITIGLFILLCIRFPVTVKIALVAMALCGIGVIGDMIYNVLFEDDSGC